MTVLDFPNTGSPYPVGKTLKDWPWDSELGKPYGDINGTGVFTDRNDLAPLSDKTNPPHYKHLGIECIEMTENMNFCLGNVVKYVYRCNLKGGVEDLEKAKWYLEREIARRTKDTNASTVEKS